MVKLVVAVMTVVVVKVMGVVAMVMVVVLMITMSGYIMMMDFIAIFHTGNYIFPHFTVVLLAAHQQDAALMLLVMQICYILYYSSHELNSRAHFHYVDLMAGYYNQRHLLLYRVHIYKMIMKSFAIYIGSSLMIRRGVLKIIYRSGRLRPPTAAFARVIIATARCM